MNLLLVEDEARVADFIVRGLRAEGWMVTHAPDAEIATELSLQDTFDVIVLDPPTHSVSERMEGDLDVQRDHPAMLEACQALLSDEGTLFFSNNLRTFELDPTWSKTLQEITDKTNALAQASMKLGEALYQESQGGDGAPEDLDLGGEAGGQQASADDDVVDADFEEVADDDDDKKSA